LAVKFHTGCNLEEFLEFLKEHLAELEWQAFMDLWSNDEKVRSFDAQQGCLVIS
jgi:hypothetical protein